MTRMAGPEEHKLITSFKRHSSCCPYYVLHPTDYTLFERSPPPHTPHFVYVVYPILLYTFFADTPFPILLYTLFADTPFLLMYPTPSMYSTPSYYTRFSTPLPIQSTKFMHSTPRLHAAKWFLLTVDSPTLISSTQPSWHPHFPLPDLLYTYIHYLLFFLYFYFSFLFL